MQLLIRQRVFSWTDTYDVYDQWEEPKYFIRARAFSLGHQIYIYDRVEREVGSIHQKLLTFLPRFELMRGGVTLGYVQKRFSLFSPRYEVECAGWQVEGDFFGWDYQVLGPNGENVARISKKPFHWGDTYVLDIPRPEDEAMVLMLAIAIDAANCGD